MSHKTGGKTCFLFEMSQSAHLAQHNKIRSIYQNKTLFMINRNIETSKLIC